jgi:hypothetical protein
MSTAIPVQVALVDMTGKIDRATLNEVAGALNEQIQADFAPVWHVRATVGVFDKVAAGTWQVQIKTKLDEPGALGYHTDDVHNQPISYIDDTDDWPTTASHEVLEMLADPFGNRMHAARLPQGADSYYEKFGLTSKTSRVHYLLEVCDPCEATSYEVGGVPLSDFLLPYWYRSTTLAGGHYSRAAGCLSPREVAEGGYVSFSNAAGEWYQIFVENGKLEVQDLGKFDRMAFGTLREFSDHRAREHRS